MNSVRKMWIRGPLVLWGKLGSAGALRTWVLSLVLLVSAWPLVGWYVSRMGDGADEPWGVLALLAAVTFSALRKPRLNAVRVWGACGCLIVLLAFSSVTTPLIQGLLLGCGMAFLLVDRRAWIGHAGLYLLSLPLISSMQFYGGYPLRWVIGKMSSAVLALFGYEVEAIGAVMHWRGEMIVIDAPCSGVQMLWSSAFFACFWIAFYRLSAWRSLNLLQFTSLVAFLANLARNCVLFFLESGITRMGEWAHSAVGIGVFAGVLLSVSWMGSRLGSKVEARDRGCEERAIVQKEAGRSLGLSLWAFASLCVATFAFSDRSRELLFEGPLATVEVSGELDRNLRSEGWVPLQMDDKTASYAKGFPGEILIYAQENRTLVVRVIERATRRFHLSADCYRAIGFRTEPMSLLRELDGAMWGRSRAMRNGEVLELRERVVSQDGQAWTDPSSWFWSALLGQSSGPWVAYSESIPVGD